MKETIFNEEISAILLLLSLIGIVMGFLSLILSENKPSFKNTLKEIIFTLSFAILAGLVMHHLKSIGYASVSLEWAVIGFVSYNASAIRTLLIKAFNSFSTSPIDTIRKIKDALK